MGRVRSLRRLLVRMERDRTGKVRILQQDGSVARFSEKEAVDAFGRSLQILRARAEEKEPPPALPFHEAIRNAAYPEVWHESYIGAIDGQLGDLSEVPETPS